MSATYHEETCGCRIAAYTDGSRPDLTHCDRHKLADDLTAETVRRIEVLADKHDTTPARYVVGLVAEALAQVAS